MSSLPALPQGLLQHAAFVRRLAADLLGDGADADDAVQETWLAALRRPPETAARGWLQTTLARAAARLRRSQPRPRYLWADLLRRVLVRLINCT